MLVVFPRFCSQCAHPRQFLMCTTPLSTLISSMSLNHHLYADDTQLFFCFCPSDVYSSLKHYSSGCSAAGLLLGDCMSFNSELFKYWISPHCLSPNVSLPHSLSVILFAILFLFLMNTLVSLSRHLLCLNLAILTFVYFSVGVTVLILKQLVHHCGFHCSLQTWLLSLTL